MEKLNQLPNIGPTLEKKLIEAGITSSKELKNTGSEQAYLRLNGIDHSVCINMLMALEGAIQGIRWHNLSSEKKDELKSFIKLKKY